MARYCGVCGSADTKADASRWRQDTFGVWYCWACQCLKGPRLWLTVTYLLPWMVLLAALADVASCAHEWVGK